MLFVEDARRFDPRQRVPQQALDTLQQQLLRPGGLALKGLARRDVTTDQPFTLKYDLAPAPDAHVPPGYPVAWVDTASAAQVQVLTPAAGNRLVLQVGLDQPAASAVSCQVVSPLLAQAEANPPPVPATVPAGVTVYGLYRGQRLQQATRLDLHPLADTIVYQDPLPPRGSVAVRGSRDPFSRFGASTGALAIVLDCSGSMGPPRGVAWGPDTKYNEALQALREVLARLPRGITVSVWVFGQAAGIRKTVEDAESTITRMVDPVTWDPDSPDQLGGIMSRLEYPNLEPWNESPIVATIVKAKGDLQAATGFRSILVLTDGMDNRFDKDTALNPNHVDIPTFLTETFRDSGIVLNIVGYKVVNGEAQKAEDQFKVVEKWPLPGKFVTVDESRQLASILDVSMRPTLRYQIDTEDNVPVKPPGGRPLLVTPLERNDQWFPGGLDPALYQLRVEAGRRVQKPIAVGRGDLLLVDLGFTPRGLELERGLYSRSELRWKPNKTESGWRMAVLQNQLLGAAAAQMLVTLEKVPDPREDTLQMLKPRWTWLELQPGSAQPGVPGTPYSLRWGYQTGYPAPAWSLNVPQWPARPGTAELDRPVLKVWWNPDQELEPADTVDRGADFAVPADLAGRRLAVDGDTVLIESVAVEDHLVETPTGRQMRSCLVVRLVHGRDRPVSMRLRGLNPASQEQRFYRDIGHSTALFWPVTKDEAEKGLTGVSFYSVNAIKALAVRRGCFIDFDALGRPDPGDVRPPAPAVNLR